jgi:NADH-quinone oxidoreductase subunit J
VLFLVMAWILARPPTMLPGVPVGPKEVGTTLFTGYVLAVELAAMLLLAALVGAFHLGRRAVPGQGGDAS